MPTTVVLGTGIIGLSTAYYLARLADPEDDATSQPATSDSQSEATSQRHEIHLVEPSPELFASASGKAAGFLAKDWFAPAVSPLGEFSFDLHRKLAAEHNGRARWGYSSSVSYSLDPEDSESDPEEDDERFLIDEDDEDDEDGSRPTATHSSTHNRSSGSRTSSTDLSWLMDGTSRASLLDEATVELDGADSDKLPRWLRARRSALQAISDTTTTGQVPSLTVSARDPHRLCQFLLDECRARGVHLHQPAHASELLHTDPADPNSPTAIRLEYLNRGSAMERQGTPNSKSPPPDASSGTNVNEIAAPRPGELLGQPFTGDASGMQTLRASGASQSPPNSNGSGALPSSDSPWRSFSSALESSPESSPVRHPIGLPPSDLPNGTPDGLADIAQTSEGGPVNEADSDPNSGESLLGSAPMEGVPGRTVDIPCDSIVIAAGCWTPRVYRTLFPNAGRIPRVTALAGHSIIMKSAHWPPKARKRKAEKRKSVDAEVDILASAAREANLPDSPPPASNISSGSSSGTLTARHSPSSTNGHPSPNTPLKNLPLGRRRTPRTSHAIFTNDKTGYSPEIFSRLTGDVWVGGLNTSSIPLPPVPTLAIPDPASIARLKTTSDRLLGTQTELISSALCFRPVAPTGRPVIARMHEADLGDGARVPGGVFVATGHGPWGISLSLGTGYVVSEMILGRKTSVDVKVLGTWEAQAP